MCSKVATLIVGLLSMLLLISSGVAARDLAEDVARGTEELVNDAKYPVRGDFGGFPGQGGGFGGGFGFGGPGGGGFGYDYPGGGGGFGGGFPWQGGPGRRGFCQFGCCRPTFMGGCRRCCRFPGQRGFAQTQNTRN